MERVQIQVLGISASPVSQNAYALIMKENDGDRRLPIIIGAYEAQAIAMEIEGMSSPRPMTHDLVKNIIDAFGAILTEVEISDLQDGTFFAKLFFEAFDIEVDARPSDAIALAVRFNAPIYINNDILEDTGQIPQPEEIAAEEALGRESTSGTKHYKDTQPSTPLSMIDKLQIKLDKAISDEDYELAANLRDEIKRILEST